MIVSFKHKGLEDFYTTGTTKGIQPAHSAKLQRILALLDVAAIPADMDLPGYRLHELKGKLNWLQAARIERQAERVLVGHG